MKILTKLMITIVLCFLFSLVSSCKDEAIEFIENNVDNDITETESCSDDEIMYAVQTDKGRILMSHVRYDAKCGKYVLDLSREDACSLGIEERLYDEAMRLVDKMEQSTN